MYLLQQLTPKWHVPVRQMIEVFASKHNTFTPKQIADKYLVTQAQVSHNCLCLVQQGKLKREECPCGRGFIYRRT